MLRTLAERFSRNIVLRRRLPRDLGGKFIYVTPESALNFWYPGLERADTGHLMDTVRRFVRRDSVAWGCRRECRAIFILRGSQGKNGFGYRTRPISSRFTRSLGFYDYQCARSVRRCNRHRGPRRAKHCTAGSCNKLHERIWNKPNRWSEKSTTCDDCNA